MPQFNLAKLFALLTFVACFSACLVVDFSTWRLLVMIWTVSLASSLAAKRGTNTVAVSALTGVAFVAALIFYAMCTHWIEYLYFYTGSRPYFMDGPIVEGVIYPLLFLAIVAPLAALTGALGACPRLVSNWISAQSHAS